MESWLEEIHNDYYSKGNYPRYYDIEYDYWIANSECPWDKWFNNNKI